MIKRIWPGRTYPLGATWDGQGVNFALFSENATQVDLCLFDQPEQAEETHRRQHQDAVAGSKIPTVNRREELKNDCANPPGLRRFFAGRRQMQPAIHGPLHHEKNRCE